MGGHYGSVQVRSEDRERVRAVAEQVAREKKIHILVAPPVNGWIALFPEMHGQDEAVGQAVAEQLDADVLHLLVHDDDIFAYWLYRDRRLVDSYNSAPGYFGEQDRQREEAMAGNPEAFRPLIGDDVRRLAELLDRSAPETFESERLGRFARVLKIKNAVNAFEYLKEGERTGIRNWRQFVEVPARAEPVVSQSDLRRQERNRLAAELKRLKAQGLLLYAETRKGSVPLVCPAGDGFLVTWPDYQNGIGGFTHYKNPWDKPTPLPPGTPECLASITSDASARRIAFNVGKQVSIWELSENEWTRVRDVPERDHTLAAALSPDGKLLASCSRTGVVITRIDGGGERLFEQMMDPAPRNLAFHPSGDWLAVYGNTFGLLAWREAEPWRDLYVGGKIELPAAYRSMFEAKLREIDFDEVERKQKIAKDAAIARLLATVGRFKGAEFPAEQIEAMKRQIEEQFTDTTSRLRAMKEGRLPPPPQQAREQVYCVGFSRDGRWFWCGTDGGLRVYEWAAVPRAGGADMPPAKWSFTSPGNPIFSVVEEVDAAALVFGGSGGGLHRLDLLTGEARELIKMGDDLAITLLTMSADGRTLGATMGKITSGPRDVRRTWTVWSYPRLRGPFLGRGH